MSARENVRRLRPRPVGRFVKRVDIQTGISKSSFHEATDLLADGIFLRLGERGSDHGTEHADDTWVPTRPIRSMLCQRSGEQAGSDDRLVVLYLHAGLQCRIAIDSQAIELAVEPRVLRASRCMLEKCGERILKNPFTFELVLQVR